MLPFNVCIARYDLLVSELPTYWDEYGELFIYWQATIWGPHLTSQMVVHERKPGSLIINTAGGQTPAYHYKRIKHWSDKTLVNMTRDIIF